MKFSLKTHADMVVAMVLGEERTLSSVSEEFDTSLSTIRAALHQGCKRFNPEVYREGRRHQMTMHRPFPPTLNYLRRRRRHFLPKK